MFVAPDNIDAQTMLSDFNGLTPFQIFDDNANFVQILSDKIKAEHVDEAENIDEKGQVTDHILLRRIYYTINKPILKAITESDDCVDASYENILNPSIL